MQRPSRQHGHVEECASPTRFVVGPQHDVAAGGEHEVELLILVDVLPSDDIGRKDDLLFAGSNRSESRPRVGRSRPLHHDGHPLQGHTPHRGCPSKRVKPAMPVRRYSCRTLRKGRAP